MTHRLTSGFAQAAHQQAVLEAVHRAVPPKNSQGKPVALRDAVSTAGSLPFVPGSTHATQRSSDASAEVGDASETLPVARQVLFPNEGGATAASTGRHASASAPDPQDGTDGVAVGASDLVHRVTALVDGYNNVCDELSQVRGGAQQVAADAGAHEHVERLRAHNRQLLDDIERLRTVEKELHDARVRHGDLQDKLRYCGGATMPRRCVVWPRDNGACMCGA